MTTTFLPLPLRALAATTASALLIASALAQAPAPAPGAAPGAPAAAATPAPKPLSPMEKNFIKNAGKSLFYQIQVAGTAKGKFIDPKDPNARVRDTATKELPKAFEALKKFAQAHGETVPAELTGSDKSDVERLAKVKEDKFAKEWLELLNKESKKLDKDFESAAKTMSDMDAKMYVSNYSAIVHNVFTSSEGALKAASGKKK
jgi:hypothetical protein